MDFEAIKKVLTDFASSIGKVLSGDKTASPNDSSVATLGDADASYERAQRSDMPKLRNALPSFGESNFFAPYGIGMRDSQFQSRAQNGKKQVVIWEDRNGRRGRGAIYSPDSYSPGTAEMAIYGMEDLDTGQSYNAPGAIRFLEEINNNGGKVIFQGGNYTWNQPLKSSRRD